MDKWFTRSLCWSIGYPCSIQGGYPLGMQPCVCVLLPYPRISTKNFTVSPDNYIMHHPYRIGQRKYSI